MKKSVGASLICFSGMIYSFLGMLNLIALAIFLLFVQNINVSPSLSMQILDTLMRGLQHPIQLIIPLIIILVGLLLILSARKIKKEKNVLRWSIIAFTLGLIMVFEIGFRGNFGFMTASILAIVGGVFSLIDVSRNK